MTQAFGLYDTVSGLMVHADLYPAQAREREMLADSLRHVRPDDLLLLDRGFPAYWLFAWLIEQGRHFCMRVDALGFEAIEQFAYASEADETVVEINMPAPAMRKAAAKGYVLSSRVFQLRLIRVRLPSGQTEILATSLLDRTRYPMAEFAALYHRRWRIDLEAAGFMSILEDRVWLLDKLLTPDENIRLPGLSILRDSTDLLQRLVDQLCVRHVRAQTGRLDVTLGLRRS